MLDSNNAENRQREDALSAITTPFESNQEEQENRVDAFPDGVWKRFVLAVSKGRSGT
jgi:hypothetical protein